MEASEKRQPYGNQDKLDHLMGIITDKDMQAKASTSDQWLIEPGARGAGRFMGRISPTGERSFYFRYTKADGTRDTLPLGAYHAKGVGGLTVAQARTKAKQLSLIHQTGAKNLREHLALEEAHRQLTAQQQRLSLERRITVSQLFEQWVRTDLQPRIGADGRREGRKDGGKLATQTFLRHAAPTVGAIPLEMLSKADLIALFDEQRQAGRHRTAQMMWADLRQMLTFAIDRDLLERDPLFGVKKSRIVGKAAESDRALSNDEIRQLASALASAGLARRTQLAIWLTLSTAVRVGELVGATWAEDLPTEPKARATRIATLKENALADNAKFGIIDMSARSWYLPDTKNERDHTIHLSDFSLAQLRHLHDLREALAGSDGKTPSPWVFPGRDNRYSLRRTSIGKQVADRQRTSVDHQLENRSHAIDSLLLPRGSWTMHDLRRTAGTLMAELGVSGDVIDECLNHKIESRVRRTYVRTRRLDAQRAAFDLLGNQLDELTATT